MRSARIVTVLIPMALVVAACTDDDADTETTETTEPAEAATTTTAGSGTASEAASPDGLVVHFTTPADGDEVSMPLEATFHTTAELGEADGGKHHMHVYYDGNTSEGEFDMVFADTFTIERELDEGPHMLRVELVNPDHSPTGAFHEIPVTVGAGGSGGGDGGDDDPGYGNGD